MKKFLSTVLFVLFVVTGYTNAATIEPAYWHGDRDLPIFTERPDGSLMVFKISSARIKVSDSFSGDFMIIFAAYDVDANGTVTEHAVNSSDNFSIIVDGSKRDSYTVCYPHTKRFPQGEIFYVENPYQIKICRMIENFVRNN